MDHRVDDRQLIQLPAGMEDWAESNRSMISRLSAALHQKPAISEDALWEVIASEYSPEWVHAKSSLKSAEQQVQYLALPENMPLGLIGKALHSEETNSAHTAHTRALANFTIVNETLRGEDPLQKLLSAARSHQKTIAQSLELSHQAAKMTAAFANVSGFDVAEIAHSGEHEGPSTFKLKKGLLGAAFKGMGKTMHRTSAALKGRKPVQGM